MSLVQGALIPPLTDDQMIEQLVDAENVEEDHEDYLNKELERQNMKNSTIDSHVINKTPMASPTNSEAHKSIEDSKKADHKKRIESRESINSEHEEFLHPNMR